MLESLLRLFLFHISYRMISRLIVNLFKSSIGKKVTQIIIGKMQKKLRKLTHAVR